MAKTEGPNNPAQEIPPGFKLRHTLQGHTGIITRIAWSPDGRRIASPSYDGTIRIWDTETEATLGVFHGHRKRVLTVAWSPDGQMLASGSADRTIQIWTTETKEARTILRGHTGSVCSVAWSLDGRTLASGAGDGTVQLWDTETGKVIRRFGAYRSVVYCVAWSSDGQTFALGTGNGDDTVRLCDKRSEKVFRNFKGHLYGVHSVSWTPNGQLLASGAGDQTIRLWNSSTGLQVIVLEGHTHWITSVSFSPDGSLLASKSRDGTVLIWRTSTWQIVAKLSEPASSSEFPSLAFHPNLPVLATLGENDHIIRIWDLDVETLFRRPLRSHTVKYTSAKIVLVGESNVGKSCLAMRLAEDRYPNDQEHGTTHGMRFWQMIPEQLSPETIAPVGERRDIVLWDMGGQDEYRLVHQLFLHDTTLALVLLDPTRGRTAFEEVEAWNKRLEKQLHGRQAVKLLVGSKMDEPSTVVDRKALDHLIQACGFAGYYETSALRGHGIPELREVIAQALDWDGLAKTSRPELFQRVRDEIESHRKQGDVVLYLNELKRVISEQAPKLYEPKSVEAVAEQLATQGVIADTSLASGERVLILQIGEIERYAGSLIVAARDNPRSVPALEERELVSPEFTLPGIADKDRLPRSQERVVLTKLRLKPTSISVGPG